MIGLAWALTRAAGWPRVMLISTATAVASGLVLVALAMLLLPAEPREVLFELVASPGLRTGTAFATVLLVVPLALLLYQAVRLGTASRERRFAGLRMAGATPNDVRKLGAVEVGIPVGVGALLGLVVYGLLRALLGGTSVEQGSGASWAGGDIRPGLVPTTVTPSWWQVLVVVAGVTSVGLVVGWRVSGRVVLSPLGVARGQMAGRSRPPRPWGLLALAVALLSVVAVMGHADSVVSTAIATAAVGLAVLGMISLSSWVAYWVGRYAETRARSAEMLLAARRLVTDPRPAGRAGAAIGGIALVAGGTGVIAADIIGDPGTPDSFYTSSLLLVTGALTLGLLATTGTLAVHSVEALLDRRREVAALAAAGTPVPRIERAQRYEAALVSLPMAAAGVLLGSLALSFAVGHSAVGLLVGPLTAVPTVLLAWAAVHVATRAVRPWLIQAADPANLRTE
jgi:hypothetical protein